jgi:hypothetical protein
MATALDLLMSTKEDVNLHSEESDICTIDAKTRAIFVPSTIVIGGVQSDKNAERIKFSCPKIVGDNLDLSKFSVRINFENVSSVDFNVSIKDQYICDDVAVDGENVTFSWLIGRNAARYMGTVRFIVCAVKTDSDSNISVEWNTAISEVPVLEGIEIDQPQIGQEEKDVINQLLELTKNTSAEAVQNVNSAKEQAIKDIQSVSQPDTTLTIEGGLAEAKATGEAIGSIKEDLSSYYPKKQGAFKCINMVSNLPDEVIMPSGIEKNILDGVCAINGTSTIDYPNLIIKKSILANHVYLFSVKMKENENTVQTCSLITRIGTKPITRNTLGEYPTQLFENKNYPGYTTFCALFSHNSDADVDFSISFDLTKTSKKVAISAKDIIITDVTGLSDTQIIEIVEAGMKDDVYYNPGKNVADALSNQAKEDITVETIKRMYPNPNGYWHGKKCLVIGDSTSATEQWQKKLSENLGMSVTTHAKGGIGFLQMVVGSLGYEGNYDNETGNTGVLQPLKAIDVYDKDLIIIFGGFNNRGTKLGEITDLYKTDGTGQNTVTGQLQFVLNWIYDLLKGNESYAQNLKCKIVLVTPYCCGKYSYADYDGYGGDSWAGYTLREMCDRIVEIAALNNCSSYNAWENSGIGRHTWTIYSASPTATKEAGSDAAPYPTNADQLHLNNSIGYPHLGDCISAFVNGIV